MVQSILSFFHNKELTLKTFLKGALLTSAVLGSSLAFAQASHQSSGSVGTASQFYVGANVNYTNSDWKTIIGANEVSTSDWKNGTGGAGFGLYAGYMLTPHIGTELGWNKAPTVNFTISSQGSPWASTKISTNLFYGAFMLSSPLPILNNLSMYLKVGPGYQQVHVEGGADAINSMGAFGLYGATGLTYAVMPHLGLSVQAAGLSGQSDHDKNKFSTNLYMYSINLAYLF
jgi:hypothetical protein